MDVIMLRRYTNLAATIHMLRNRCITLLNPVSWPDRNDAFYLAEYKRRKRAQSVLALCFTEAQETFHHWQVFSNGSDGICIEFDKARLLDEIGHDRGVTGRSVVYRMINEVTAAPITDDDLPFLKRLPYQDEREYRLLYVHRDFPYESHDVEFDLSAIRSLRLSPWLPEALADAVKETLRDIDGCEKLPISRSGLLENERWKGAATAGEGAEGPDR